MKELKSSKSALKSLKNEALLLTSALIVLTLLSGCTKAPSNDGLTVIEYSKPLQKKAAKEIEGGQCPTIGDIFIPDYSVLRDQARVK